MPNDINKAALVDLISRKANVTKQVADDCFDAFVDGVKAHLRKGNSINIKGLVTISVVKRAAKTGRNPRTGDPVKIPARRGIKAKFSRTVLEGDKQ